MNIFKVLSDGGGSLTEPNLSALLAYFLDPGKDHGFRHFFLHRFLNKIISDSSSLSKLKGDNYLRSSEVEVSTEKVVRIQNGKKNRRFIDIVLRFPKTKNSDQQYTLLIENKIRNSSYKIDDDQIKDEIDGYMSEADENEQVGFLLILGEEDARIANHVKEIVSQYDKGVEVLSDIFVWKKTNDSASLYSIFSDLLNSESIGEIDALSHSTIGNIKSLLSFVRSDFRSYEQDLEEEEKVRGVDIGKDQFFAKLNGHPLAKDEPNNLFDWIFDVLSKVHLVGAKYFQSKKCNIYADNDLIVGFEYQASRIKLSFYNEVEISDDPNSADELLTSIGWKGEGFSEKDDKDALRDKFIMRGNEYKSSLLVTQEDFQDEQFKKLIEKLVLASLEYKTTKNG